MKTKISILLFCVGCSVILASCGNANERLVPKDALAVMKIDLKSIGSKADLDKEQKEELSRIFRNDQALRDAMDDVLDDPTSFGINLLKPVYAYVGEVSSVEEDPTMAVALVIKNENKFQLALENLDDDIKIKDKSDYKAIYLDDEFIGLFDSEVALLGAFADKKEAERLFCQDAANSFFETPQGKNFQDMKGEVTLYANFKNLNLQDMSNDDMTYMMAQLIGWYTASRFDDWASVLSPLQEMEIGLALSFDKRAVNLTYKLFRGGVEMDNQRVSTQMLDYVSEKNLAVVALSAIDGKAIASSMKKSLGDMANDSEEMQYIIELIRCMNGTLTFAVNGTNEDNMSMLVCLPIKIQDIQKVFGSETYSMMVEGLAEENMEIMEKEGVTCLSYQQPVKTYSSSANHVKAFENAGDYYAYLYLDMPTLFTFTQKVSGTYIPAQLKAMMSSIELKVPNPKECILTINLDTEDNSLAFLLDEAIEVAD